MKKYKLNQAYIDRETSLVKEYGGDLNMTLQTAERRLNEQARNCRPFIAAWAVGGAMLSEIHDILVDWNNHTLANHMEVIKDLYTEVMARTDLKEKKVRYYRQDNRVLSVPFAECIERVGKCNEEIRLKSRVKGGDGRWYTF